MNLFKKIYKQEYKITSDMNEWQKQYYKLSNKICGKCKPKSTKSIEESDKHPLHCCYGFILSEFLENLIKVKNEKLNIQPVLWAYHNLQGKKEIAMINPCTAYDLEKKCLVYDYRSSTCRSYFCEKWTERLNDDDKRIIIKGSFSEISEDRLLKHIKNIYPRLKIDYIIISSNPGDLAEKVIRIKSVDKILLDEEALLKQINPLKKLFNKHQVIITNTSLDDFMNNEKDWDEIKHGLLEKYLFIIK